MKIKEYLNYFLEIIFPPLCSGCKKILKEEDKNFFLCKNCFEKLKINLHFFCPICKNRIPFLKILCHRNVHFTLGAPFDFDNKVIQNIIYNLKYHHNKNGAIVLGFSIVEYLLTIIQTDNFIPKKFFLIPVPLYPSKERKRGYNQALLIARQIKFWKDKLDINKKLPEMEITNDLIIKIKNNQSQTLQKTTEERKANVKGVFQIQFPERIKNQNFIIVDDVFTSGATTQEIVKLLKNYGAAKLIVLTGAKA